MDVGRLVVRDAGENSTDEVTAGVENLLARGYGSVEPARFKGGGGGGRISGPFRGVEGRLGGLGGSMVGRDLERPLYV